MTLASVVTILSTRSLYPQILRHISNSYGNNIITCLAAAPVASLDPGSVLQRIFATWSGQHLASYFLTLQRYRQQLLSTSEINSTTSATLDTVPKQGSRSRSCQSIRSSSNMFALRNARSLHTGPHPGPLRQVIRSPILRALSRPCEPTATCDPVEQYSSCDTNLEDEIWHMASFDPISTGLPMWILLSPAYEPLDQPRMLVYKEYDIHKKGEGCDLNWFQVTVEEEPQVVEPDTGSMQQVSPRNCCVAAFPDCCS